MNSFRHLAVAMTGLALVMAHVEAAWPSEPIPLPRARPAGKTAKPEQTTAQHINADVKTDAAKPEGSKHHASRQAGKSHMRGYEADEAKARRIAARYGVYW